MIRIEDVIMIPVEFVIGLYEDGILIWVLLLLGVIGLWVLFK